MRPSPESAGQSYDALATQITPPTSRETFIANDQRDPNAGRPGYIQSDDGSWRPDGSPGPGMYPSGGGQTRIIQSYPSHQASSLVSRSHGGNASSHDFRGMMEDIIRAVEGMGHIITIEVDGAEIARVAAKGMAQMARR